MPIYNDRDGRNVGWEFVDGHRLIIPIPFDILEIMAVHYARGMFSGFKSTFFTNALESLIGKTLSPNSEHRRKVKPNRNRYFEAVLYLMRTTTSDAWSPCSPWTASDW